MNIEVRFLKGITLDIINQKNEIIEVITFGIYLQIKRPMFSILNALQSLRGKFDFIYTGDTSINLYINLQKAILEELFNKNIVTIERLLEPYTSIENYIEKSLPINFNNVKKFIQLEVLHAIDEFTRYLHPEVTEYINSSQNKTSFKGKNPSEKYTEAMEAYTSFMGSNDMFEEMLNTFKNSMGFEPDNLLDNRSFIPVIKSKRYSQLSEDIRYVSSYITQKKDFKIYEPDQLIFTKNKLKSKSYYSNSGILPLLWAEIKYAIENDIFARQCSCGKYFELTKKNMMKKICNRKCGYDQRKKKDRKNPNYDEITRLKQRKSRLRKRLLNSISETEKKKLKEMIDKLKKEIDALKQY